MQKRKVIFCLCMLVTGVSLLEISAASRFHLKDYSEENFASKRMNQMAERDFEYGKETLCVNFSRTQDSACDQLVVVTQNKSGGLDIVQEIQEKLEPEELKEDVTTEESGATEEIEILETEPEAIEGEKELEVVPANSSVTDQIFAKTNAERAACGLPALSLDGNLCKVAQFRASECAANNSISHTRPDGSAWYTALDLFGVNYSYCEENLAWSSVSSEDVVALWMGSDGHRKNILSSDVTKIGIGFAQGPDGFYFVQSFSN